METFCEKKSGKTYRGKTTGGVATPLSRLRVNKQLQYSQGLGCLLLKERWESKYRKCKKDQI